MYTAFYLPVQYKVYDADNRLVTNDQGPSLNGLGKIVCTGEMIDFTIERVHPEEVKITVGENALPLLFNSCSRQATSMSGRRYASRFLRETDM